MPKISVLMSVNNCELYLRQSIESIINQTFKDFEFIIVNDGSSDSSYKIINSYHDKRIKLINNKTKLGLSKSLNKGLKICKSKIIARMDADDISKRDRLEKQYQFFKENKNIDVLGGQAVLIDKDGNKIDSKHLYPISNNLAKWELLREVPFCHPAVMFRKNALEKAGLYNEKFIYAQDFELWKRLAQLGFSFSNLPDKVIYYRKLKSDLIRGKKTEQKNAHIKILNHLFISYGLNSNKKLVYYYYYAPKIPLKNKNLLIQAVKISIELYDKFIVSHTLSKLDQNTISQSVAHLILNVAKVQKHLFIFSRINLLIMGYKICKKIITHYQFRKTLLLILINK